MKIKIIPLEEIKDREEAIEKVVRENATLEQINVACYKEDKKHGVLVVAWHEIKKEKTASITLDGEGKLTVKFDMTRKEMLEPFFAPWMRIEKQTLDRVKTKEEVRSIAVEISRFKDEKPSRLETKVENPKDLIEAKEIIETQVKALIGVIVNGILWKHLEKNLVCEYKNPDGTIRYDRGKLELLPIEKEKD